MKTLPKDIKEAVSENIPKISASKDEVQSIMKNEIEVIIKGYHHFIETDTHFIRYDFEILKDSKYEKDSTHYEAY